ncbi:hypothetical protein D3C76_631750 [compost metagenome]
MGLGNHAAADPGRHRDGLLRPLHGRAAQRARPGRRAGGRGPAPVDRARLLQPRAQPAQDREAGGRAAWRRIPPRRRAARRTPRHRPLHRRRHRQHLHGPARTDPRRQRQARAGPLSGRRRLSGRTEGGEAAMGRRRTLHPARAGQPLHPGDDGPRRHPLHPQQAQLPALPAAKRLPRAPARPRDRLPRAEATQDPAAEAHPDAAAGQSRWRHPALSQTVDRSLGRALEPAGAG